VLASERFAADGSQPQAVRRAVSAASATGRATLADLRSTSLRLSLKRGAGLPPRAHRPLFPHLPRRVDLDQKILTFPEPSSSPIPLLKAKPSTEHEAGNAGRG